MGIDNKIKRQWQIKLNDLFLTRVLLSMLGDLKINYYQKN